MKCWIVIFHCVHICIHFYLCVQFFFDFPDQCLLWCFPCLNLTAKKLPPTFQLSISALCSKLVLA